MKNFITIEGGEGSGKSTITTLLSEELTKLGIENIASREPGGVKSSERIRNVIFDYEVDPKTEVLLFAAARNEHLKNKVIPALESGKVVICDRYVDSSLAYQGVGHGLGIDEVKKVNDYIIGDYLPEKTFFLDVKPEDALKRITSSREITRFDLKEIEFHNKVYDAFDNLCKENPDRYIRIDASGTVENAFDQIMEYFK
ncbi:MAG: dTMP kinase [Mycoplasmatales bacterium]